MSFGEGFFGVFVGDAREGFIVREELSAAVFVAELQSSAPVQVSDASGWNATFGMHRADFVDRLIGVQSGLECRGIVFLRLLSALQDRLAASARQR